ncbi:MAG TPA: hypothetical protein VIW45_05725 [Vicinamibacterales bacterium]|jgi:hypothetical protein
MRVNQAFEEIRVYDGVAERTGVHFQRSDVRRSSGCCASLTEFLRRARAAGEGTFYMPLDMWPPDTEQLDIRRPWVVMS